MKFKLYKTARSQLIKIWQYTEEKWGEQQANKYIRELYEAIEKISSSPELWRKIEHEKFDKIFYHRHKKHFIFFRTLSHKSIGVISILHEKMNIPEKLK